MWFLLFITTLTRNYFPTVTINQLCTSFILFFFNCKKMWCPCVKKKQNKKTSVELTECWLTIPPTSSISLLLSHHVCIQFVNVNVTNLVWMALPTFDNIICKKQKKQKSNCMSVIMFRPIYGYPELMCLYKNPRSHLDGSQWKLWYWLIIHMYICKDSDYWITGYFFTTRSTMSASEENFWKIFYIVISVTVLYATDLRYLTLIDNRCISY